MTLGFFKRLFLFIVLYLLQVLLCNQMHILGMITPLIIVYFVITFRRNYPKWGILLWCFLLGLSVDISSNMAGMSASALTLIGAIQPYLLSPFVPRDSADDFAPTRKSLGGAAYFYYTFTLILIYSVVFFALEFFSFADPMRLLMSTGGSAVLTWLIIYVIEIVRRD